MGESASELILMAAAIFDTSFLMSEPLSGDALALR